MLRAGRGCVLTRGEMLEGSEGAVREFLMEIDAADSEYLMRGGKRDYCTGWILSSGSGL